MTASPLRVETPCYSPVRAATMMSPRAIGNLSKSPASSSRSGSRSDRFRSYSRLDAFGILDKDSPGKEDSPAGKGESQHQHSTIQDGAAFRPQLAVLAFLAEVSTPQTPKRFPIPQIRFSPELQDDYYLNLVDWLGTCVYLWSASNSRLQSCVTWDRMMVSARCSGLKRVLTFQWAPIMVKFRGVLEMDFVVCLQLRSIRLSETKYFCGMGWN